MRWVLVIVIGALSVLSPQHFDATSAQVEPVGIVTQGINAVSREYQTSEDDYASLFSGDLYSMIALGIVEDSISTAEASMRIAPAYIEDLPYLLEEELQQVDGASGVQVSVEPPITVDISAIGDESIAYSTVASYGQFEFEIGIVLVRDEAWVQTLIGYAFGSGNNVVPKLAEIAVATKQHWPSMLPVQVRRDGLRIGGVWSMVPVPESVPAHLHVIPESDEGPGPDPASAKSSAGVGATAGRQTVEPSVRLAQPFDATLRIILAGSTYTSDGQGHCSGQGMYSYLREDGLVALKSLDGAEELVLKRSLEPGFLAYDLQLQSDVCVLEFRLEDVPPRAGYQLVSGTTSLGVVSYDQLATGEVVEVVIGE